MTWPERNGTVVCAHQPSEVDRRHEPQSQGCTSQSHGDSNPCVFFRLKCWCWRLVEGSFHKVENKLNESFDLMGKDSVWTKTYKLIKFKGYHVLIIFACVHWAGTEINNIKSTATGWMACIRHSFNFLHDFCHFFYNAFLSSVAWYPCETRGHGEWGQDVCWAAWSPCVWGPRTSS